MDTNLFVTLTIEGSHAVDKLLVSCITGEGIEKLENVMTVAIRKLLESQSSESVLITRERHRRHLKKCTGHLDRFLSRKLPMDLAAEELR